MALTILPIVISFFEKHSVSLLFVEGPLKEKLSGANERWPYLFEKGGLLKSIDNSDLLSVFYHGDSSLIKWAKDPEIGLMGGDRVCTNGIHLLMSEAQIPSNAGEGATLPRIFLYGSCLAYGACVPSKDRISSFLQELVDNEYVVVNLGVKNGRSLLNDLLYMLNTGVRKGDIVIDLNRYRPEISREIRSFRKIHDSSAFLNSHPDSSHCFLDSTFHANSAVCRSLAAFIHQLVSDEKGGKMITGENTVSYLQETGRLGRIDRSAILGKSLMHSYIEYVKRHKRFIQEGTSVGSVILTANPLTRGHEYLVNYAKRHCSLLYVFIVEEDRFQYSTLERMSFAKKAFNNPDIIVLSTGNTMTAFYTFPEYFSVSHASVARSDIQSADYHCFLFGKIVAPILGITKRFIGEEILGSITAQYNETIKRILPSYGIDVEVVPRLLDRDGIPISASRARSLTDREDWDNLARMLSPEIMGSVMNLPHRKTNLIRAGNWSSTYKVGDSFIKKYKYSDRFAIKRESEASMAALNYGLMTPSYRGTFEENGSIMNCFEYVSMRPIDEVSILQSKQLQRQCTLLIGELSRVPWNQDDHYWKDTLLPEFEYELSFLGLEPGKYLLFLSRLTPSVFIHGDLTCQNLGLTKDGSIVVYDFQHGSLGPAGWDKSFFASTFPAEKFFLPMTRDEMFMTEIISAIRLGRSMKKGAADMINRENLFQSWLKNNR